MASFQRTDVVGEHVTRGDGGKEYPSAGLLAVTNAPPMYGSVPDLVHVCVFVGQGVLLRCVY